MSSPAKRKINGWLTPTLLATILVAIVSANWVFINDASAALAKRHDADIAAIRRSLELRDRIADERFKASKAAFDEIKQMIRDISK
ncbi:MAG: hypothetical protein ACE5FA_06070 [Dehalococcoidia bacterium]